MFAASQPNFPTFLQAWNTCNAISWVGRLWRTTPFSSRWSGPMACICEFPLDTTFESEPKLKVRWKGLSRVQISITSLIITWNFSLIWRVFNFFLNRKFQCTNFLLLVYMPVTWKVLFFIEENKFKKSNRNRFWNLKKLKIW